MHFFNKNTKTADVPRRRQGTSLESGGFQRNRTITGSLSDGIYTAATTGAQLESPRTKAHSLRQVRRRVGALVLAAVLGVVLFSILLTQYVGSVRVVSTDAGLSSELKSDAYARVIQDYLGSRIFERYRFSLNQQALLEYMQVSFPEIASIRSVHSDAIGSATVAISLRKPVASWLIGDKTYYVDTAGEAFETNYFSGSYVKIVDESGVSITDGAVLASGRFLSFVGRIVSASKQYGYTVIEARIPSGTTRELEVKLDGVISAIRMSVDRPAGEQAEDMVSAVRYLQSVGRSPGYIDVRVASKAFYQ